MFKFPKSKPGKSLKKLREYQIKLLHLAESSLGKRDETKEIKMPVFSGGGPYIIHTVDRNGAYAVLSNNAENYWPTTIYELAHETVHLLNPKVGNTNWLEEGVAVAFSIHISETYTAHPIRPPEDSVYHQAHQLVQELPAPLFDTISDIRNNVKALSHVTSEKLRQLFPDLDKKLITKLTTECTP